VKGAWFESIELNACEGRPVHVPALLLRVVEHRQVLGRNVVPHQQITNSPVVTVDELRSSTVRTELGEQLAPFRRGEIQNLDSVALIDEQALTTGDGMGLHNPMDRRRPVGQLLLGERRLYGVAVRHQLCPMMCETERSTEMTDAILGGVGKRIVRGRDTAEKGVAKGVVAPLGNLDGVQQRTATR